jgi:hypothetical protein
MVLVNSAIAVTGRIRNKTSPQNSMLFNKAVNNVMNCLKCKETAVTPAQNI